MSVGADEYGEVRNKGLSFLSLDLVYGIAAVRQILGKRYAVFIRHEQIALAIFGCVIASGTGEIKLEHRACFRLLDNACIAGGLELRRRYRSVFGLRLRFTLTGNQRIGCFRLRLGRRFRVGLIGHLCFFRCRFGCVLCIIGSCSFLRILRCGGVRANKICGAFRRSGFRCCGDLDFCLRGRHILGGFQFRINMLDQADAALDYRFGHGVSRCIVFNRILTGRCTNGMFRRIEEVPLRRFHFTDRPVGIADILFAGELTFGVCVIRIDKRPALVDPVFSA